MGATPRKLLVFVMLESFVVTLLACVPGVLLSMFVVVAFAGMDGILCA